MNTSPRLSDLWQQALSRPVHGAGCGCSSPVAFVLTPDMFELDIIDYVTNKRALENDPAWTQAVAAREARRIGSFPDWLEATLASLPSEPLREAVRNDVTVVLQSRIDHSVGRFEPAAAKQQGWLTSSSSSSSSSSGQ